MAARHKILGGKVHLYKREDGRFWQCAASVNGKQYRESTGKDELAQAEDVAENWYYELRGMFKRGELVRPAEVEKTFAEVTELFLREFAALTEGQRRVGYVKRKEWTARRHLLPFMGDKPISQVNSGLIQEYRLWRVETAKEKLGRPPARGTVIQEIVVIRQVLKTALRRQWIAGLPDLSQPYQMNGKISHRAWFSPDEYRTLYTFTQKWAKSPPIARYASQYAQLHDLILFMANTGIRPDEAARLQYRDVSVVEDDRSGETILEIECRGKRGYGPCKSTANAVPVFRRLQKRNQPSPTDLIFPKMPREQFNAALAKLNLKHDREGRVRTFYSLRHTYISFRLLEGAHLLQLAWNCRTSVDMIEKHYAAHIKTRLDASAINVRRGSTNAGGSKAANDNAKVEEDAA